VKKTLKELSIYTEYLDNNSAHDLQPTKDPSVFMLTVDKRPYPDGDFALAKGSCGQVLEPSALPRNMAADVAGPLMRWETQYNGWSLLLAEVMELLRQVTQGAGMVETEQVERVTMVMELVHHVLKAETAATVEEFAPFVSLSYDLVHRFSILNPAPLDLLSEAVNCIACAAKHFPGQVWHKVMQTGLLPYLTENVDDLGEVLSGQGLHAGMLGSIEAGTECVQARYPLTLTVLNMLTNLVQAFSKAGTEEELQACLLHILKEIFPLFRKWRYTDLSHRKQIGQQCLTLFHKVLNLASLQNKKSQSKPKSSRPSLHEVCVYSLLFTEAGRALIEIVATGVDNVEMALVQQGRSLPKQDWEAAFGQALHGPSVLQSASPVVDRFSDAASHSDFHGTATADSEVDDSHSLSEEEVDVKLSLKLKPAMVTAAQVSAKYFAEGVTAMISSAAPPPSAVGDFRPALTEVQGYRFSESPSVAYELSKVLARTSGSENSLPVDTVPLLAAHGQAPDSAQPWLASGQLRMSSTSFHARKFALSRRHHSLIETYALPSAPLPVTPELANLREDVY
ncbi:nucleoporin NUP188-like, partial [Littorina saxatilis]|uniref:nucleoporin NUP188-like n=1 Tax=Littorina saxatilis TaxID=31220 RepID=UPI0038B60989